MRKTPRKTSSNSPDQEKIEVRPESLERFLEIQKQREKNEAASLKLREKELQYNYELAKISMAHQKDLFLNDGPEHRRKVSLYGRIFLLSVFIFLSFILGCLYTGHKDFALTFLQVSGYLFTTAIGYYFGKRSNSKGDSTPVNSDPVEEAEIIKE